MRLRALCTLFRFWNRFDFRDLIVLWCVLLSDNTLSGMSPMNAIGLLIASDYAMTREGIRSLLQIKTQEFSFVGEAQRIVDAPERCRAVSPDVILLEVSAPEGAAFQAVGVMVRECKARIVVLTNITEAAFVRSMLASGVLGYVLKHSSIDQLIVAIKKAALNHRFIDPLLSDIVVKELLPKNRQTPVPPLSGREQQVLGGLASGLSNRQLADRLKLSTKTVETYRGRLYHKLHLHDRAELVNYALALGLLSRMRADH
jgi:two-component system, NarL family, response regulator NreC